MIPADAALLVGRSDAAARVAGTVASRLRGGVCSLRTLVADNAAGSVALAAEAVAEGVDLLVVLGGDGLVHLAVQACAGTNTALGVIPAGTGNDLARELGMPVNPVLAADALATALAAGRTRRIDLGRVDGGSWFATVLCAGFDAGVAARANAMHWPRGARRYDLAILAELAAFTSSELRLYTDTFAVELTATMVAVGNTRCYGGGIPICPDAELGDGLLDVTVVGACRRSDLLRMLPRLRTGRHVDHPAVRTMRGRCVRMVGDSDWHAYADGEPQRSLPLSITCVPGVLTVVPAQRL
jgi:diacylglycerol kinase (ATP)